jgi:hypothetical protein
LLRHHNRVGNRFKGFDIFIEYQGAIWQNASQKSDFPWSVVDLSQVGGSVILPGSPRLVNVIRLAGKLR